MVLLTECPLNTIDGWVWGAIEAAEWADKGKWPTAGGWLDETESCLEVVRYVRSEHARWKAQLTER